jgi:hypothetical protein
VLLGENIINMDSNNTDVPIEAIMTAFQDGAILLPEVRLAYAERLLANALQTRDPHISHQVASLMDSDPALETALEIRLNETLPDQPDAVYAFIRTHLAEHCNEGWVERLKLAAEAALEVAITDAGTTTIVNWLTLISREPATYELGNVLHNSILAAQSRAHDDPELARQLVILSARRDPASLDTLLADEAFLAALPDNLGRVLRDYNGDALALLQNRGVEVFMVGMARAARACAIAMFSPAAVAGIWELYTGGQPVGTLPAHYQAESIILAWVERGVQCLSVEALDMLAILILTSRRDELFLQLLHQDNGSKALLPRLIHILERSHRTINDAMNLIGQMMTAGDMRPQQAVDTYLLMLDGLEWQPETLVLTQQLTRTLQKYATVTISADVLWRLFVIGSDAKDELITKVAAIRLLKGLETTEVDTELTETLRRLAAETLWSEAVREDITDWWRDFIRKQPMTRLAKLDKALEGKRGLDEARAILQTLTAMRRMMGGRTMPEFSQAVQAAFGILEALSDAFEMNNKRTVLFDPETARVELNAQAETLPLQERHILAKNLKELAQMIAEMGDNRTRANLIRRGDDLDRDLMSGEELPHSAVDAMKWLAGYWGGTQEDEADGEG